MHGVAHVVGEHRERCQACELAAAEGGLLDLLLQPLPHGHRQPTLDVNVLCQLRWSNLHQAVCG